MTPPNRFRHLTVCLSKAFSFARCVSSMCLAAVGKRVPRRWYLIDDAEYGPAPFSKWMFFPSPYVGPMRILRGSNRFATRLNLTIFLPFR